MACAIGLLSARAAMVAGAADMGGKGCGSGGSGLGWSEELVVTVATMGGSVVMLSEASLMPEEFIDMCRKEEVELASDVSAAMVEMVDRVEKSGSETGAVASVEDSVVVVVISGMVEKRDIPSVDSAKPESVMSSDGKNEQSPRVGRLDLRDSDS